MPTPRFKVSKTEGETAGGDSRNAKGGHAGSITGLAVPAGSALNGVPLYFDKICLLLQAKHPLFDRRTTISRATTAKNIVQRVFSCLLCDGMLHGISPGDKQPVVNSHSHGGSSRWDRDRGPGQVQASLHHEPSEDLGYSMEERGNDTHIS